MNGANSDAVLGVHSGSEQFHQSHSRNSWSSEYDAKDALPPKHPGVHRSSKQVAFRDTDSTYTPNDVRNPSSRDSWSCESDSKDHFPVYPKSPETPPDKTSEKDNWDPERCSESSGNSASCESDSKDEIHPPRKFPGIHRSCKTKQRVVTWEIDLLNDVKSALNDLHIDTASPKRSCSEVKPQEMFLNGEFPVKRLPADYGTSQSSRSSGDCDVILAPPNFSNIRPFSEFYQTEPSKTSQLLDDGDVRRIVDGILKELRPPQTERSISCSSSCSGCCSCCYGSCSNFGTWTPRPSTPAVDIPKIRPKPAFLPRVHGHPVVESPVEPLCGCSKCIAFKSSARFPSVSSSSSWMTGSFCSKCLPPFDNDSLDSKISCDSLNPQSIFSLDSLNSLTDPDSLEYSKTNISTDSLDSLDSCCNYDSLSDSKDSGFFSCSLPVVC